MEKMNYMHKQMENLSRNENYKKGVMKMLEINSNKKTTTKSEMKNSFDYVIVYYYCILYITIISNIIILILYITITIYYCILVIYYIVYSII